MAGRAGRDSTPRPRKPTLVKIDGDLLKDASTLCPVPAAGCLGLVLEDLQRVGRAVQPEHLLELLGVERVQVIA